MTKSEIIKSLEDQARDKEALANGDADSIFAHDAQVLLEAAELLQLRPSPHRGSLGGDGTKNKGDVSMDCILCGSWFSSGDEGKVCPTCERAMRQLRLNMSAARLRELAQAEKDGRLVVLSCKVGDEVWTNFSMSYFREKSAPYSAKVVFVGLNDSDEMGRGLINVAYGKHDHMMQFPFSEIGKIVFLTREEAEAALKKEEGEKQ